MKRKNKKQQFTFEDKIILLEFITSVSLLSDISLDPVIMDAANRLKIDAFSDVGNNEVKFNKMRYDIVNQIDNKYHMN